jgi:hypothetical protein
MTGCRRCGTRARRSKPQACPARAPRAETPLTAVVVRPVLRSEGARPGQGLLTVGHSRGEAPTGMTRMKGRPPGPLRSKPPTPRAGRLGIWRTCGLPRRSSTERRRAQDTRQASMSRGVEARGSIGTHARPARPRFSLRAGGSCCVPDTGPARPPVTRRRRTRRQQRIRAAERWLAAPKRKRRRAVYNLTGDDPSHCHR